MGDRVSVAFRPWTSFARSHASDRWPAVQPVRTMVHVFLFVADRADPSLFEPFHLVPVAPYLVCVLGTFPEEVPRFPCEVLVSCRFPHFFGCGSNSKRGLCARLDGSDVSLRSSSRRDLILPAQDAVEVFLL